MGPRPLGTRFEEKISIDERKAQSDHDVGISDETGSPRER